VKTVGGANTGRQPGVQTFDSLKDKGVVWIEK